jgi:hypothetical protein
MRLLLDEQFPFDFVAALGKAEVLHVHSLGRAGVKNGELLRRAQGACDVFVRAVSNRMADLAPHVAGILEAAILVRPGEVVAVGV